MAGRSDEQEIPSCGGEVEFCGEEVVEDDGGDLGGEGGGFDELGEIGGVEERQGGGFHERAEDVWD